MRRWTSGRTRLTTSTSSATSTRYISIDKDTYVEGEPIEMVASYNTAVRDPSESFRVQALDPATGEPRFDGPPIGFDVTFDGVEMTSFSVVVALDLQQGLYKLEPLRELDDPEPTLFMVVKADA